MRQNRRGKKGTGVPIEGKFVPITLDELNSEAFSALRSSSAKLYVYLKAAARTAAYRLQESQERSVIFDFTYTEAESRGFSTSTFIRAIKELWAKGFIDVVSRGGLKGNGRTNSHYRLCAYWKSYGKGNGKWHDRKEHDADPFETTTEPRRSEIKW